MIDFSNKKIIAVVITFNRFNLLQRVIDQLRKQTVKLNSIVVIDNGSSDGTKEWLSEQKDLHVIFQDNVGSSGGQYRGFKEAYNLGADWIWTMDDDIAPQPECLENYLRYIESEKDILAAKKIQIHNNQTVQCDTMVSNLSNPFKGFWTEIIPLEELHKTSGAIEIDAATFEGPIFHRSLIDEIGLPQFDFFIYADDTEYFIRAKRAGYRQRLILDALLDRLLPFADFTEKFDWKHYYIIRNIMAIDVLHGNILVRLIRPFGYLIRWLGRAKTQEEKATVWKAFKAGYFYRNTQSNKLN